METNSTTSPPARWPRPVGGHVALDLVNTDIDAQGDPSADVLRSASEFLAWCEHHGVPVPADEQPDDDAVTRAAGRLRTAVRTIVEATAQGVTQRSATAQGAMTPAAALADLRAAYAEAITRSRPVVDGGRLQWEHDTTARMSAVDQLAVAAVDLLRHGPTDRLKVCPSCGFLFLDMTKNHSRRWCSMEDCGTEEKMRRYVARRAEARRRA